MEKEVPVAPTGVPEPRPTENRVGRRIISGVITSPHLTEKASKLNTENKYVFKVSGGANKISVKRAVEGRYGVNVVSVYVSNMPGKERRRGRQIGIKPGFKKAIVKVKEGQIIESQ